MKFATSCAADLVSKVKSVSTLEQKTIVVLSIDDLVSQLHSVPKPAAGVLYEGARTNQAEAGKQIGVTVEVVFSILLLSETSVLSSKVNTIDPTHDILDKIRESIHGTRAPTGHFWKWVMEAPAATKGSLQVWVQRWSCLAQLVPPR